MLAAIVVAVVSLALIVTPFALAVRMATSRDAIDRRYVTPFLVVGVLALLWVGYTGARLVAQIAA